MAQADPNPGDHAAKPTGVSAAAATAAAGIPHLLLSWFLKNKRELPWREEADPYRIWISEVMLQQTRSDTAAAYYRRWLERFPNLRALAEADEGDVLKAWEGLGYYSRARNLHRAAREVIERFGGELPADREQLLSLPGVGEYTAAAVASIAFARPVGVVDGNVIRVVSRLLADGRDTADRAFRRRIRGYIESSFRDFHPGWVNQAWMELGALVCQPKPRCDTCPLHGHCRALREGRIAELPIRRSAVPLPVREGSLLVVLAAPLPPAAAKRLSGPASSFDRPEAVGRLIGERGVPLLLVRRPAKGLLGGLWEFPNYSATGNPLRELTGAAGIELLAEPGVEVRHRYSHFEARFRVLFGTADPRAVADPLEGWDGQRWVKPVELSSYPRPQIHIKAMQRLGLA
jgi:A/G-specific adenine glycosylase